MQYLPAFGLLDNPFAPRRVEGVDPRLTDNLVSRPLQIDKSELLRPLYVADAGPFRDHEVDFTSRVREAGYLDEDFAQSLAFLITGPEGTGKLTLTNVLLRIALGDNGPGRHEPLRFRKSHDTDALLTSIKDRVQSEGQPGTLCVLVVESVSASALTPLTELYLELLEERVVLFIMESDDLELIAGDAAARARASIVPYKTDWLTPSDAQAYVSSRLTHFRAPEYCDCLCERDAFPFEPDDIARVGLPPDLTGGSNGNAGRMGFRNLNKLLSEALRHAIKTLPEGHDIRNIDCDDFPQYMINLRDAYDELSSPGPSVPT